MGTVFLFFYWNSFVTKQNVSLCCVEVEARGLREGQNVDKQSRVRALEVGELLCICVLFFFFYRSVELTLFRIRYGHVA